MAKGTGGVHGVVDADTPSDLLLGRGGGGDSDVAEPRGLHLLRAIAGNVDDHRGAYARNIALGAVFCQRVVFC